MPVSTARTPKSRVPAPAAASFDTQALTSFDTLSYAKALQQGGIPTKQAEAMATGLLHYLKNEVATKSDIILLRTEIKGDIVELRAEIKGDIAELRAEIKGDIAELRTELRTDMAEFKTEIRGDIIRLQAEVAMMRERFKIVYWAIGILAFLNLAAIGFTISLLGIFLSKF